jgi:hypothetical protein
VAGDGEAWALLDDAVWEVGEDGRITERPELSGLDGFAPVPLDGGRLAVAEARCAGSGLDVHGAGPDDCPEWDNVLELYDGAGSPVREVDLGRSEPVISDGAGALGPRIIGASGAEVWVAVPTGDLVAVSASGDVDTLPLPLEDRVGELCVIDRRLFAIEIDSDFEQTTVGIRELVDRSWRPVAGAERTFDGYYEICGPWGFAQADGSGDHEAARWTPDGGWVATGPAQAPPPRSVGVGARFSELYVWGGDGEILRRGTDGSFARTGAVVVDPDGGDDVPAATSVDERDGTLVACARFHVDGTQPLPAATEAPAPARRAARGPAGPPPDQDEPLVCDMSQL